MTRGPDKTVPVKDRQRRRKPASRKLPEPKRDATRLRGRPGFAKGRIEGSHDRWLTLSEFSTHLDRVAEASRAKPAQACLVHIGLHEGPRLEDFFGARAALDLASQVTSLLLRYTRTTDYAAFDPKQQRLLLLFPDASEFEVAERLKGLAREVADHTFYAGSNEVRLTPLIGVAQIVPSVGPGDLHRRAELAVACADVRLDLLPVRYGVLTEAQRASEQPRTWKQLSTRLALPLQIFLALVCPLVLPLAIYTGFYALGIDMTHVVYLIVVAALLVTAIIIWTESILSLRRAELPEEPKGGYAPASAIIAAYLPNEAATVVSTLQAFLRIDYPAPLQVILAYNTPHALPIERELAAIAKREPRITLLPVALSSSKAQNINAALPIVTGDFVGIFDADHQPAPDSFRRAWRWIADGADAVQGSCVVRNGEGSLLRKMIAVEFAGLYKVSHSGRARLHQFGIFGGSNGYWRTELLHRMRMREFMLTEDIDTTMRALTTGAKIISDPDLVSRELSPGTLAGLWNQRMRWAQGWWQVTRRHLRPMLRSDVLSMRQRLGVAYLLGWSQIFPWVASQILPLIIFWSFLYGFGRLDWLIPVFVLTTLFTISTGPAKTIFSYRLADSDLRSHRSWFVSYFLIEALLYTPFKNLITRVAHIKEWMGEREWKVTARTESTDQTAAPLQEAG